MGGAEPAPAVTGGFVERDGCTWYRIRGVDLLPPFLTSVASGSDHWLFASSRGPLTAGRRDVHSALFPYRTEDALHDAVGRVGSRTLVAVDGHPIWEPGTDRDASQGRGTDEAWKDTGGTAVAFEWVPGPADTSPAYTGTVQIRAVEVGGDVATQLTTDAEFPCIGQPVRTDYVEPPPISAGNSKKD